MKKIYIIPQTERNVAYTMELMMRDPSTQYGHGGSMESKERGTEFEATEKKGEEGVTYGNIW